MYDQPLSGDDQPEPAQKLLYHATGKLYRYLAGFAGENPDAVERAYHDSLGEICAGADPVLIGDAIGHGIGLGFSLAERRRALQRYHDELVRRELAPPAYDTQRLENEAGEVTGIRVLVSEPDCEFATYGIGGPKLLVRSTEGGEVGIPLGFQPGRIEPVDSSETVSEVIVRPEGWSSAEDDMDDGPDDEQDQEAEDELEEDIAGLEAAFLQAAREVVLDEPELALAAEEGNENHIRLAGMLIERKPSVPLEKAPDYIQDAIRRGGLDKLEERSNELAVEIETMDESEDQAESNEDPE